MKKSKLLLPIYLTIALVFLITAVVVSLTAGVNLGVDFVGRIGFYGVDVVRFVAN